MSTAEDSDAAAEIPRHAPEKLPPDDLDGPMEDLYYWFEGSRFNRVKEIEEYSNRFRLV